MIEQRGFVRIESGVEYARESIARHEEMELRGVDGVPIPCSNERSREGKPIG
jgi:hypothetical protein